VDDFVECPRCHTLFTGDIKQCDFCGIEIKTFNGMREYKIKKGPFKGEKVIAETDGIVKTVVCECGYTMIVTFFDKEPSPLDVGPCPKCGGREFKWEGL